MVIAGLRQKATANKLVTLESPENIAELSNWSIQSSLFEETPELLGRYKQLWDYALVIIMVEPLLKNSEYGVDKVRTKGGASAKDGSITKLLSKFLSHLTRLIGLSTLNWLLLRLRLVCDSHRWYGRGIWVWIRGGLSLGSVISSLLLLFLVASIVARRVCLNTNVVGRENAYLARPQVLTTPPLIVCIACDRDLISCFKIKISWIGIYISIKGHDPAELRRSLVLGWGWWSWIFVSWRSICLWCWRIGVCSIGDA